MTTSGNPASLLILGLGNVLCGDDGLGVAAIELLSRQYRIPDGVRVLDGGTLGLSLLGYIGAHDDVILVDAIGGAGPPGTFVRLDGDQVGPAVRTRLSPHQVGVADLLDALHLLSAYPRSVVLLGLVPETLELNFGLSPRVEMQIAGLVERVVAEARRLGQELFPLNGARSEADQDRLPRSRSLGL